MATTMANRPLGSSGREVSALSLGSWSTFDVLPREQGLEVMVAAREAGITFLDDARYDDPTGEAPMETGWSEVVFGELFRAAGWPRDEVVVANKLWMEHWPMESPADELEASLGRMGFDHLDLVYAAPPPVGMGVAELVGSLADLVAAGKLGAWGVLNWPASSLAEAVRLAWETGAPAPCAAQLPYSVVQRRDVEDPDMVRVLRAADVSVVASASLAGGALTGKYRAPEATGRLAGRLDEERLAPAFAAADALVRLADELDVAPAALAIAFAAANAQVASVLVGATSRAQVEENVAALDLLAHLGAQDLVARVDALSL